MTLKIKVTLDHEQINLLMKIPSYLRKQVAEDALQATAAPINRAARKLAPDSEKSRTRYNPSGWSKKYTLNPGWWDVHSGRNIGTRFFRGTRKDMVYAGVQWTSRGSRGNKQLFNHPFRRATTRTWHLWGIAGQNLIYGRGTGNEYIKIRGQKPTPRVFSRPKSEWFIKKAYNATISQQRAAFIRTVKRRLQNLRLGGTI